MRSAHRLESHCSSLMQAEPTAPSVQLPPPSLASAHSPSAQCSGALQRSPIAPALQVDPAPAESLAQRSSAQSASSSVSHWVPTEPSVQTLSKSSEENVRTQCPSTHWSFSAQGAPTVPSV